MMDRHIRRGVEEYAEGLAALLPQGRAWPRDPESVLMRVVEGLAGIWGTEIDPRAADLLERETDPRATVVLLPEWERAYGLPDDCLAEPLSIADRQKALVERVTLKGGQSPALLVALARRIGHDILIKEHSPFMAGISRVGDTRQPTAPSAWFRWEIGAPEMRFYWSVIVLGVRITWFRATSGQCGVDPHVRVSLATDLECLLRRFKPAHTELSLDYSGLTLGGSMAGTP